MITELTFRQPPPEFGGASGTLTANDDGTFTASITFQPSGGAVAQLASGTDVVVVLDASFSMFAGFYRNGRVLDFAERVISFVAPYDDDGVDVYLHSLRDAPFRHLGSFTNAVDVTALLGEFMETGSAMKAMGQKTLCASVIRDAVRRLKEVKGSTRVFIEVITDGAFDDQAELEAAIVELGLRYNTPEHPMGFRVHFSGVGPGGTKAVAFLQELDDGLEAKYPGFIDCVDYDAATSVDENLACIVKELKQVVRLNAENAMLTVAGVDGAQAMHICDAHESDWQDGASISFEGLPMEISVHAVFAARPVGIRVDLVYLDGATADARELVLTADT